MQKQQEKRKTRQKRTHMSSAECKRLRREMGCAPCDMYRLLGLPRRTYQDYESGRRGIPQGIAAQIREAHRRDREFMDSLPARIETWILRDFPNGVIPSANDEKEEE